MTIRVHQRKDGTWGECSAGKKKCPLGGEHLEFDSEADVTRFNEQILESEYGSFGVVSSSNRSANETLGLGNNEVFLNGVELDDGTLIFSDETPVYSPSYEELQNNDKNEYIKRALVEYDNSVNGMILEDLESGCLDNFTLVPHNSVKSAFRLALIHNDEEPVSFSKEDMVRVSGAFNDNRLLFMNETNEKWALMKKDFDDYNVNECYDFAENSFDRSEGFDEDLDIAVSDYIYHSDSEYVTQANEKDGTVTEGVNVNNGYWSTVTLESIESMHGFPGFDEDLAKKGANLGGRALGLGARKPKFYSLDEVTDKTKSFVDDYIVPFGYFAKQRVNDLSSPTKLVADYKYEELIKNSFLSLTSQAAFDVYLIERSNPRSKSFLERDADLKQVLNDFFKADKDGKYKKLAGHVFNVNEYPKFK